MFSTLASLRGSESPLSARRPVAVSSTSYAKDPSACAQSSCTTSKDSTTPTSRLLVDMA